LRENLRSIQGWLLLLVIPFGCLVTLTVLGPTLGIALPDNPVIDWVRKSITQPTGIVPLAVLAATYWVGTTFARHLAAVYIGPITFTLTLFAWICFWFATYGDMNLAIKVLLWVVCAFLLWIIKQVQPYESDGEQSKRDERAEQILNAVLSGSGYSTYPKFSVFLLGPLDYLEEVLARAVLPRSQLLTISVPGEARVISVRWQCEFQKVTSEALNIFVTVANDQGTLRAVRWLIDQDNLAKSIFVMPETPTATGVHFGNWLPELPVTIGWTESSEEIDHAPRWQRAVEAFRKETGITLPPYDRRRATFTLRDDGSVHAIAPLNLSRSVFRVAKVRKAVRTVSVNRTPPARAKPMSKS